ncbi:PFL_4669 family integrating conjugative element protein [Acidovorax sp. SUPP2825]|uniref:PFL_4669 family integrating conjugative element protein n=1 Tax=Acidovorax sp. SUPP2825 TaxID=2920879 RepID=UPI0023DE45A1|nr:TIGR03761 family integrating conjugative element protein [Acidovorax sp. SUPP2825]GKS97425.1 TIGR03761 family integrating conjugative element protein [Acidovorax sp. SUPP2825]
MATRAAKKPASPTAIAAATAATVPAPVQNSTILAPPRSRLTFSTEPKSPFQDGYSISGEEAVLAEFLAGDMSESDPLYDRYVELEDRKDRLERMQADFQTRRGADPLVAPKEFFSMLEVGNLVDTDVDQMSVHTKEAIRMFMGRTREPGKEAAPIIGGKRIAAALRNLWMLTANDNPYADWALLRHEESMQQVQRRLARESKDALGVLEEQKRKGLTYSLLQSSQPQVLNLGFRSPYGYAVSSLIVDFDHYVRVQKTLARKNLRSDDQTRQSISEITRFIRRVFNETARFDRWLTREEVRGLCRADFVPEAGGEASSQAAKRLEFATEVFGAVPADVFTTKLQPRHSRRRIQISAVERQLLQTVGARLAQAEQADGSAVSLDAADGTAQGAEPAEVAR